MKNRARAMQILRNKLFDMELQKQQEDIRSRRKHQVLFQKLEQRHDAGTQQGMAPQSHQGKSRTGRDSNCVGQLPRPLVGQDYVRHAPVSCHARGCTEAGLASSKDNNASVCVHACAAII